MATKWFDSATGTNDTAPGRGDSSADPYQTYAYAESQTTTGDTIKAVNGDQVHPSGHYSMTDGRTLSSESKHSATLKPAVGETNRVLRFSNTMDSSDDPIGVENVVVDAIDQADYAIDVQRDTSGGRPGRYLFDKLWLKGATDRMMFLQNRDGRTDVHDLKMTGDMPSRGLSTNTSLGEDGDQAIHVKGGDVDVTMDADADFLFDFSKLSASANEVDVSVQDVNIRAECVDPSQAYTAISIEGADTVSVAGIDATMNINDNANDSFAIRVFGKDASTLTINPSISRNVLRFYSAQGFGISLGKSQTESHISGGAMGGNVVFGKYYPSNTPHNFLMGQGTDGVSVGDVSVDGYVGFLLSRCADSYLHDALCVDCYGPSFYIKGATAASVYNSTAVISAKNPQRDQGVLACVDQAGIDTVAGLFEECSLIVKDPSAVHLLTEKEADQTCLWNGTTYYLPDSVNPASVNWWQHEGVAGNFSTWLGQSYVTEDRVVLLSQAEIDEMYYKAVAKSLAMAGLGGGSRYGFTAMH